MITRIVSAVSCLAIVLAGASVANAQTFKAYGATFSIVDSDFTVRQSQTLTNCNINGFAGAVNGTGSQATIDVNGPNTLLGPGLCTAVGLNASDWVVVPVPGSTTGAVKVHNVKATSLLGTCNVVTSVALDGTFTGNTLDIPWQPMPGVILGFPTNCYVEGYAETGNAAITLTTP